MIVLVMGVSGSGKTTIGEALARELGFTYLDADDYHPAANVAKMAAGVPLQDSDRWPWLEKINEELLKIQQRGESAVVGCSALKQAYRERVARGLRDFEIVYLRGEFKLIHSRIAARKHRFMPATLLQSQFDTLEPPASAIEIDVSAPVESSLSKIRKQLPQR
jgi:carbohydrate kinase (thermoresistant glucokinase family)